MNTATDRIIGDLSYRSGWLEQTAKMNVERIDRILSHKSTSAEYLRQALADLRADTVKSLHDLQITAAARLLMQDREPATLLPFTKPEVPPPPPPTPVLVGSVPPIGSSA